MATAKNIELTFASEEMKNKFEKEFERITSDTALMEKIDAVDTIEEIYEVCKEKVQFSLDQYREIMKDIETQLKSNIMDNEDEELSDDDLEDVVGQKFKDLQQRATHLADKGEKALEALRNYVDQAEEVVADEFWPLAKYQDLLTVL